MKTHTDCYEEICERCERKSVFLAGELVTDDDGEFVSFRPDEGQELLCAECVERREEEERGNEFERQAGLVLAAAEEIGWSGRIIRSGLSESCYVELQDGIRELKIRFSSHSARPTYDRIHGQPDFEVGPPLGNAGSNGDWQSAIRWLRSLPQPQEE
jgi:hypothetical protein